MSEEVYHPAPPLPPALPEAEVVHHHEGIPVDTPPGLDHHAAAMGGDVAAAVDHGELDPNAAVAESTPGKKRNKKLPLTKHEASTFANRGIYVDIETGQLRCSCNHKPCDKWDAYGYTRHFTFKCHVKYETERLDETETNRLRECKETFLRMNPIVEERTIRKKRKTKDGEKILTVEELRIQERHWMTMWKDSRAELRQLRGDLRNEVDVEVRAELMQDIEGLKKRKNDWGKLLGINEMVDEPTNSLSF